MTTARTAVHLIAALALTTGVALASAPAASAAQTRFTSCDQMHQVYEFGISKDGKAQARAVRDGMYRPPVKAQVYADSYQSLDRDKDGTMCEVPR